MTKATKELTSHLERLLNRQLTRIRQRFFVHGLGTVLTILALAAVVYYPLDRYLRLPGGVRILLTVGLAIGLAYVAQRFILYPLRRALSSRDVAVAIEGRFPELQHKLISAFQLGQSIESTTDTRGPRNQSREMIEAVISDAAAHAGRIPHDQLLDTRQTAKVWVAAAALLAVVIGFGVTHPVVAGVFVQRIFGMDAAYPRETYLVIERPSSTEETSAEFRATREGRRILVTLAAGGDLPVLVRADGVAPREVVLAVKGGRGLPSVVAMSARSGERFKHTFRRVAGDFSFYAQGGDDPEGDVTVEVTVIHPPRVERVRASVEFPAYTRRPPPPIQEGGSIEALIGSKVQFDITATTAIQSAKIEFLESGQETILEPYEITDDGGQKMAYRGSIIVTRSDRYQVELIGDHGLRNPHPGTYHIVATPDHPPVGKLLSPLDDGLNVRLPDGIVPIRISTRDDYGLMKVTVSVQSREGAPPIEISLFAAAADKSAEPVKQRTALAFLDLAREQFKSADIGQSMILNATLVDNREPEANTKVIGPRQVRIIGETDLLRRVSGHFRRIRDDVEQNLKLLQDRHERLGDIIDDLDAGTPIDKQQILITAVEVAQGRIRTAASRIHLELMRAFDFHLFNRLETSAHAVTVMERYRTFHEQATEAKSFFPEFYRDLSTQRVEGRLGAMDKALDPILAMIQASDQIAETLAPDALRLLAKARVAESNKDAAAALRGASESQRNMIREFETLLARLVRWNEFQDVITNTRALLDQQRDVEARTKNLQGSKDK